jgi:hypothetical protein
MHGQINIMINTPLQQISLIKPNQKVIQKHIKITYQTIMKNGSSFQNVGFFISQKGL